LGRHDISSAAFANEAALAKEDLSGREASHEAKTKTFSLSSEMACLPTPQRFQSARL
jgi:hypothetical protein